MSVTAPRRPPFSSTSVPRHLARGLAGLLAFAGAAVGLGVVGPVALLLAVAGVVAWRGCPTCWAVGLLGTITHQQSRRACRR